MSFPVRAITLDLDDTLWPIGPAINRAEEQLDAWMKAHAPRSFARWPQAKRRKLREMKVKVLRGDDRPGALTLDEYCSRPHALVSFSGDLCGNIDQDLARPVRELSGGNRVRVSDERDHPPDEG